MGSISIHTRPTANDDSIASLSPFSAPKNGPLVLFDTTHGQPNWAQTGFDARTPDTSFLGVALACDTLGCPCTTTKRQPLVDLIPKARLLIVPPPTGHYLPDQERWAPESAANFTAREIGRVLRFVHRGGRLLAFSYRFGDSFTHTNLRDLLKPLGCFLNHDAVLDMTRLRADHPLQAHFDTPIELLPLPWSQVLVRSVRWRASATFRILRGARVLPLALSPGGRCIAFDRTRRQISFASQPVAVAGLYGKGRFAAFGGPHIFETGTFGLLGVADNAHFLRNVLSWLLSDEPVYPGYPRTGRSRDFPPPCAYDSMRELTRIDAKGRGKRNVAYVERLLKRTGMLKALSGARWMP